MLVELKCKSCNSELKMEPDGKIFVCEYCGSRYIFAAQQYQNNEQPFSEYNSFEELFESYSGHSSTTKETSKRRRRRNPIEEPQYSIDEEDSPSVDEEENEYAFFSDVEQKASWIRNKRCRHCGGKFKGVFFKKCKTCKEPKDYGNKIIVFLFIAGLIYFFGVGLLIHKLDLRINNQLVILGYILLAIIIIASGITSKCPKCGKTFGMKEIHRETIGSRSTTMDIKREVKNKKGEVIRTYTEAVPATRYYYACVDECRFCGHRQDVRRQETRRD